MLVNHKIQIIYFVHKSGQEMYWTLFEGAFKIILYSITAVSTTFQAVVAILSEAYD